MTASTTSTRAAASSTSGSPRSATPKPTKAENIAAGESSAAAALAQWKASPPHRAILLKSKLKVMGVGRARNVNSQFGWYWTADFGGIVTKTMTI